MEFITGLAIGIALILLYDRFNSKEVKEIEEEKPEEMTEEEKRKQVAIEEQLSKMMNFSATQAYKGDDN